jgi:hypothetical protein
MEAEDGSGLGFVPLPFLASLAIQSHFPWRFHEATRYDSRQITKAVAAQL